MENTDIATQYKQIEDAREASRLGLRLLEKFLGIHFQDLENMREASQNGEDIIFSLNVDYKIINDLSEVYGQDNVLNKLTELIMNELNSSLDAEMKGDQVQYTLEIEEIKNENENAQEAGQDILKKFAVVVNKTATKTNKSGMKK